ncbi:MAG: aminoacyl-tRNA hydrolase [Pseudomonadota bacterium]
MRLFVGLGNPGRKHAGQRHNIGFMALDRIAADHGLPPWRAKFQGETTTGLLGGTKTMLLKPMTFMNLSGQSVGEAMRFFRIAPRDVVVFHDELDLAPGKLRCKTGGGHAGHNGLRSLHQHIGDAYGRVRLGIGHPGSKEKVTGHVLGDFAKADAEWLEDLLRGISDGAPDLAAGDSARFMNRVSLRTQPPREGAMPAAQKRKTAAPGTPERTAAAVPEASSETPAEAPADRQAATPTDEAPDETPLAKLMRRFGGGRR